MRERGYHEYSAIYVFLPGYLICVFMNFFPAEGFILCSVYFQTLYIMLLKNIQSTVLYIDSNPNVLREKQKKTLKKFKDSAFGYCQACSVRYAVTGFEYLIGGNYTGVKAGLLLLETFTVLLTVYLIRPRLEAGFSEEMLFDINEPDKIIPFFQAGILNKKKYDEDTEIVAIEYPDSLQTIACGKLLDSKFSI